MVRCVAGIARAIATPLVYSDLTSPDLGGLRRPSPMPPTNRGLPPNVLSPFSSSVILRNCDASTTAIPRQV